MPTRTIAAIILVLLCASGAHAARETKYRIHWKQQDGLIRFETVCHDYGYGTIDYRQCRMQAQHHFGAQCERYRARVERQGVHAGQSDRANRRMFCDAASRFTPIR